MLLVHNSQLSSLDQELREIVIQLNSVTAEIQELHQMLDRMGLNRYTESGSILSLARRLEQALTEQTLWIPSARSSNHDKS